jgi:hypothetical protein
MKLVSFSPTRFAARGFVLAGTLAIAAFPLVAHAELPPHAYEELKKAAPEAIMLTVLDTKVRTVRDARYERTSVFAQARVDGVTRSKTGLKKGQIITLRTVTEKAIEPGWAGPAPIPIVQKGQKYLAWLKRSGDAYYAAARGQSFETPQLAKLVSQGTGEPGEVDCECAP